MLDVEHWGLISYREALDRQFEAVDRVSRELKPETLIFCSHPPIVTLGRGTKAGDVFGWTGDTIEVGRGGRATYHGPSQVVVYPILDLNSRGRDLHQYLRSLEDAVLETVQSFGVQAEAHSVQKADGGEDGNMGAEATAATGVWIGSRKLASIGIGVRRWVSFHGLALNLSYDPEAFVGLKPCGFAPGSVVSLEEAIGSVPARETVESRLEQALQKRFA